jgi:ABC transporter related protein
MFAQATQPSLATYAPVAPQVPPASPPQQTVLEVHGVTKRYGRQTVVNQLNLAVPRGGVYGFLGPNGAGKSTTMKMILGLAKPTTGEVRIFGQDLRSHRADILPRIGSLIEGPAFYPHLTGAQNLRIVADYLSCDRQSVDAVLDIVGLTDAAGKRARQYSLGMKQRLGIAMALISSPELLLLDEPTNGLDPAGVAEIRSLITQLAHDRGITVMVSSHLLSEIEQMADIVGIIQAGHLRYQGPLSGLQDAGNLVMKVNPVNAAVAQLEALGLRPQSTGNEIILPPLRDDLIAEAVARLVGAGVRIARVELQRKSLEQAFLELTETPIAMPLAPQATGRR